MNLDTVRNIVQVNTLTSIMLLSSCIQVLILSLRCTCFLSLPAVYSDWSVLAELLLGFVHLSDEIDEALSGFWHPLLWPVGELELADCSGLAVLGGKREQVFSYAEKMAGGFGGGWGRLVFSLRVLRPRTHETNKRHLSISFADLHH